MQNSRDDIEENVSSEAGFMTLEALGALAIVLLMLPMLARLWDVGVTEVQKRAVALHLGKVGEAAAKYTRKNYANLLVQSSASSGPVVSIADLRTSGFLPQGFGDRNAWGQEYTVYVRKPKANELQTVVLTNGGRGHTSTTPHFGNSVVPSAAALVEGAGGFVPTGDLPGTVAGSLRGSYGSWVVDLGGAGIPDPGAGHLGYLANFDASALAQDYLYRVAVPGSPDLNAMFTDLDMRDHAVKGVKEAQFISHDLASQTGFCSSATDEGKVFLDAQQGLYVCRNGQVQVIGDTGNSTLLRQATLAKAGDRIAKPICPAGTATHPEIFVAPSIAEAGADAPPMTALQAWATSLSDTEWQVHLRLLTTNTGLGWVEPAAEYGRLMVMTTCAPNTP